MALRLKWWMVFLFWNITISTNEESVMKLFCIDNTNQGHWEQLGSWIPSTLDPSA